MTIPVYRHNQDHDDWEVASVYDSDDCDSMGRSACDEPLHSSSLPRDPALRLQDPLYDDTRPHVRYSVPPNYLPPSSSRTRWDTRYAAGKQSRFIVPPPGVIFPPKDWASPPQDAHWLCTPDQTASPPERPVNAGLIEPPPSSLLLSPSSPPRAPSPLIGLPSPSTAIAHGHPSHAPSGTVIGTGTRTNVNRHVCAMSPPPRYHELAQTIQPRLAEAGCQAHPGISMSPPRRSGHDLLFPSPSYASGPGHASMHRTQSSEEMMAGEGRLGGRSYEPGGQPDLQPLSGGKYGYEREEGRYDGVGRARSGWPQPRERRPSIWRRFVRRFSPSQVSVGQT